MIAVRAEHELTRQVRRDRVVVTHTGRQYVSEILQAAQEAGVLQAYLTGVQFGGNDLLSRVARSVAGRSPRGLLRSVDGRTYPQLDQHRILAFPLFPLAGRLARPLPAGQRIEGALIERWGDRVGRWIDRAPQRPAVVHSFEGQALEAFRAARRIGATTILDCNNAFEFANAELAAEGIAPAPDRIRRRLQEERAAADHLIVPSDFVRDCLLENGVDADRIVKIPLGAPTPAAAVQRATTPGPTRFLFVGHIGARKGIRYLLEAWRRGVPDAELLLIGAADEVGRGLLADLPAGVTHLGYVPWLLLQEQFDRADVFVFPSLAEGSALVNYQALATGLPVITTPNAGSVVRDGIDGFVVPPRDVEALAARMRELSADRELRARLGVHAAASIADRYTWGDFRRRVASVYDALLDGRPVPAEPA